MRPINFITIALALLISAAARLIWFNANQDRDEDSATHRLPPGVVTRETLPFNSSLEPSMLDLRNDGTIVLNGVSDSIDGVQALLPSWSKERRVVSVYREPNTANDFSYTKEVDAIVDKAGLATEARFDPQK